MRPDREGAGREDMEVVEVALETYGPNVWLTYDHIEANATHHFIWDPIGWDPSDGWVWTFTAYPYPSSWEFPEPTTSVEVTEAYFLRKGQELGAAANETQFNVVVHNNGQHPANYYVLGYGIRNH
jgi:hypothetical protein